ncbi:S1/P1 nuclease [Rasiella sp. SM2506]|uniref:S1/P1 nuclease n=1 Tax=Rasiella sp. SM2506 TaxID=3423914 RepID=UPI003D78C8C3
MVRYIITVLLVSLSIQLTSAAEDWGKTGHRATGEIAEQYLSKKAKRTINKLLNGESLALVSNYGDDIKSDPAYRKYGPWHYVNFAFDGSYEASEKSEKGDLYAAINTCVSVLKADKATKDEKAFYLKMLVHFMGDLHQPMHIGVADDKGGNDFQVRWFNDGTNLHTVWDSKMLDSYEMSYSELAANAAKLSKFQLQAIQEGTVKDWMNESRILCKEVYATTEIGDKLGYRYMYDYVHVVRGQLQKGGIRLAVLLNEIFG